LFARLLGYEDYRKMADYFPVPLLAGEWVFSQAFYGQTISSWIGTNGMFSLTRYSRCRPMRAP